MANNGQKHGQHREGRLHCGVCGMAFNSDVDYGEHIKIHEFNDNEAAPSPLPATKRYHEGNPGVTAGVAQHEAGGQFSGEPSPERRPYPHRPKVKS